MVQKIQDSSGIWRTGWKVRQVPQPPPDSASMAMSLSPRPSGWDPCNKSSGPWSHTFGPGGPSVAVVFRMTVRTGYVSSIPDLLLAGLGPSAMSLAPTPVLDTPHLLAKGAEAQSSGLSPSLWSWWGRAGLEFRLDALPTAALQVHASRCSILKMVG